MNVILETDDNKHLVETVRNAAAHAATLKERNAKTAEALGHVPREMEREYLEAVSAHTWALERLASHKSE